MLDAFNAHKIGWNVKSEKLFQFFDFYGIWVPL